MRDLNKQIDKVKVLWNRKFSRSEFFNSLKINNWKYLGSGVDKTCYYKDNLVVKVTWEDEYGKPNLHAIREWEQWLDAPNKIRKLLTKTYALHDNVLLFQELVPFGPSPGRPPKKLFSDLELFDTRGNYGRDKYGDIKFYDWVWRCKYPWLENPDLPLTSNISTK